MSLIKSFEGLVFHRYYLYICSNEDIYKQIIREEMKKSPLSIEEQKEVEFLKTLSYDELGEYVERKQLVETRENVIKDIDMTYEEFLSTYDAVDLSYYLGSFGIKIK